MNKVKMAFAILGIASLFAALDIVKVLELANVLRGF